MRNYDVIDEDCSNWSWGLSLTNVPSSQAALLGGNYCRNHQPSIIFLGQLTGCCLSSGGNSRHFVAASVWCRLTATAALQLTFIWTAHITAAVNSHTLIYIPDTFCFFKRDIQQQINGHFSALEGWSIMFLLLYFSLNSLNLVALGSKSSQWTP